ncbi:twin-arginine translocase subunit TatC [Bacteroides salyersiae]|nr:twin-arginine translocase subunit TatC [Bacteroides salyersiae]
MVRYRRHAFIGVMVTAAIITPPDLFTLILVTVPMYLLYELCIVIIKRIE